VDKRAGLGNPMVYKIMKRSFDLLATVILLVILIVPMIIIALLVKTTSKGPFLYWSDRVGVGNKIFPMPKFRTMRMDTPAVATHLLTDLRKSSLDELPQLWSVLKGDMSFVGPRPALFNQDDLIALRTERGIHRLIPGITGWAQVNGRDDIPIPKKVKFDEYYLQNRSLSFDLKILVLTFFKVTRAENVSH
jgi:O-antigen biosynthesis protein WbqP